RITCPAWGSRVSVPPPCPVTVYEPAYPSVAVTGVVADRSSRTTARVAGGGSPCRPDPDEPAGENTPVRHVSTAPAATSTTPAATQPPRRRPRDPAASAAAAASACRPGSRPRQSVPLMIHLRLLRL